jgi:iron-sulfur cluster repair protein YtfE (RIC family)
MYVTIGRRPRPEGLVGLLLECHERIRSFGALAQAIGRQGGAPDELREACARCRRYFAEALPLHVADEEESILPLLRGKDPTLDAALGTMHVQHEEHAPVLAQLLEELDRVHGNPGDDAARARLAELAAHLMDAFEAHLANEETVIFPKLATLLSPDEQNTIIVELRERRAKT